MDTEQGALIISDKAGCSVIGESIDSPQLADASPETRNPPAASHEAEDTKDLSTSYDTADAAAPARVPGEAVTFRIGFGKHTNEVKREWDSTVGELKAEIEQTLRIPASLAKLMMGGKLLKDDNATLRQVGPSPQAGLFMQTIL